MYETFYKLSGKPFRLSPDPRLFFNSHSHRRALSYLLYGVKQGDGFIIITGDVGTGKSTLVCALAALLKDQNIVTGMVVTTQIEAEDLLRVTAAEFGLPYQTDSKAVLLKNLEGYFKECALQGRRALLLVDEAQNLPPRSLEELRMLSNFQMGGRPLLQSFLLGQKEFRHVMRSPGFVQLRQRVIAAYHLRPLDVDETRGYIEHRLGFVGWNQDPTFADDVFVRIHRVTEGVPRRINVLCDRLLLFGCLEEMHRIDVGVVKTVTDDLEKEDLCIMSEDESDASAAADATNTLRQAHQFQAAGNSDTQRLAALEASLESLGSAMQKELVLLRKAILESHKTNLKKEVLPENANKKTKNL